MSNRFCKKQICIHHASSLLRCQFLHVFGLLCCIWHSLNPIIQETSLFSIHEQYAKHSFLTMHVCTGRREGRLQCTGSQGESVPCCSWQPDSWVGAYMALTVLTILWSILIVNQLRVFVLSGTIAQWCVLFVLSRQQNLFMARILHQPELTFRDMNRKDCPSVTCRICGFYWIPPDRYSPARYFAPPDNPGGTKGTTLRSLKHALGPSFGSLSFGAAILTFVQLARNAMEQ